MSKKLLLQSARISVLRGLFMLIGFFSSFSLWATEGSIQDTKVSRTGSDLLAQLRRSYAIAHNCDAVHHASYTRLNGSTEAKHSHSLRNFFLDNDPGTWTTVTTNGTPTNRHENAFVEVNGKFYLIGGRNNRPVNIYTPSTNTWSQGSSLPKDAGGQTIYLHHFQAVNFNGLIYVVGAFVGSYPNETPVSNIYIYNPATDSWTIGPQIPVARRRGAAGVVVYNNKIYMVGGITNGHSSGSVKWLDEFAPATGVWRTLPDANFARDHFHAAVVGTKLYAAGGRRSSAATGQAFSLTVPEVDVFNFSTGNWLSYPNGLSTIPTQRAGTTVAVVGNEVLVLGGESANNAGNLAHKEVEALNTVNGTWRSLANLNTGRHGTQAVNYANKIYIAAGSGSQGGSPELNSLEVFQFNNPVFTNWTARTLAQGKRAEGQSVVYNKKIYVFNGLLPTLKINNTNEVYDPATNQWTLLTPMPNDPQGKPYAVTHNGIALVDNTVWIVGGRVGNNPGPVTDKVWIYNIATNSWAEGPKIPAPRAGGGLVRLGRRLHLFGGFGVAICNDDKGDHFVYDLDNPSAGWQTGFAPLPIPRNHFGSTTVGGKIYAIGGQYGHDCGGGQDQKFVHEYDPLTNAWTQKKDLPYANSHIEPATFVLDGKIMVVGGERNGRNILQYNPATDTWVIYDQIPTAVIATSGKVIDNYFIVSHGGAPGSQQSQDTTWVKSINRTKSTVLSFWPNQLSASATAGNPVTLKPLLGTFTDKTNYTINTANRPAWLTVNAGPGTTDESGAPVTITLNPAGLSPGTYTYTLTATAPGYTNATLAISFTVPANTNTVLARINAGGPAVTTNGIAWSASQYFSGGKPYTNSKVSGIAGTDNDAVYLTEYSATANLGAFNFAMPVPANGLYTVKLHFAEIYWGATGGKPGGTGQRIFTVNLEGGPSELSNYDIIAEVGTMTAVVKTFDVSVSDGILNIDFTATANQPKISAIEVLSSAAATNNPPVLAAIGAKSVNEGSTLTVPVSATDPDGDAVIITATNLPSFGTLTNNVLTFTPGTQAAGSYPITIKATDSKNATDQETFTLVVNDVPAASIAITNFILINADTDQEIRVLTTNDVINLASLPTSTINIRATTNPATIGSVKFELSGKQSRNQTETGAPYALYGDNNGNYHPWTPTVGTYTLKGTPYSASGGSGTAGSVLTISFSVTNNSAGRTAFIDNPEIEFRREWRFYPNPTSDILKLEFETDQALPMDIQVTNVLGQSVVRLRKQDLTTESWNVRNWPQGIYFITVQSKAGAITRKLVKQ